MRLAFVAQHPSQYLGPLLRRLAQHVPLHVFYQTLAGAEPAYDPDFQTTFAWDVASLHGYDWERANVAALPWRLKDFDVVIVHGVNRPIHWAAFLGAWYWGKRLLLRGEFTPTCRFPWLRRWLFGRIDGFLAIGTIARNVALDFGVPAERIWISPYAVDNAWFQLRSTKRAQNKPLVVLFVGKIIARKRPMDLLDACQGLDCGVVFAGDGPLRPALEREIARRDMNAWVTGFLNQSAMPTCYASADLLVMPSETEPWGLALNEAMACGLPVIATSGVAAAADLVDGNGFTFQAGNIGQLAECLGTLLADPALRQRMGVRSKELVQGFTIEKSVAGILQALASE